MSLEDRFRLALADVLSEVKVRLEAEFEEAVTAVKAEADRERLTVIAAADDARAAAVADVRSALQTELQSRFETETASLVANHEALLAQAADAERRHQEALDAQARLRAEASETIAAIRAELREAQAAVVAQREEFDRTLERTQADHEAAAAQHSRAADAHQTAALRLLESVRGLDGATTLSEVLDALTVGASKEAGRAAMLVVKGDRLIGWRSIGFGAVDQEPRAVDAPTNDGGALAAAVNSGCSAVVGSGSVLAAPTFSDAPAGRPGLAVPLLVAGRPVAVLYADDGTATGTTGWTSPVEVLVRHAGRCLEGLAVQRVTASKAAGARVGAPA